MFVVRFSDRIEADLARGHSWHGGHQHVRDLVGDGYMYPSVEALAAAGWREDDDMPGWWGLPLAGLCCYALAAQTAAEALAEAEAMWRADDGAWFEEGVVTVGPVELIAASAQYPGLYVLGCAGVKPEE